MPHYSCVDEAYSDLLDEGHGFGFELTLDDLVTQLRRCITLVRETVGPDVIFDRCPIDYIAYLAALNADPDELHYFVQESVGALRTLDGVIFVPVEARDLIGVSGEELPKLRRRVDFMLRDLLLEDSWGLKLQTVLVHGSPADRATQVLSWMDAPDAYSRF